MHGQIHQSLLSTYVPVQKTLNCTKISSHKETQGVQLNFTAWTFA